MSAGVLLVANPELPDANFDRTVVLVLAHGADGSVGVVLNRPGEINVSERFPGWGDVISVEPVIFEGGPVNRDAVIGVAVRAPGVTGAWPEGMLSEVFPNVGIVDLERSEAEARAMLCALRVFAGYAGWSPGQLAAEVATGGWWVVKARTSDVWTADPHTLWRDVLRRQGGALALVSSYPKDPELN